MSFWSLVENCLIGNHTTSFLYVFAYYLYGSIYITLWWIVSIISKKKLLKCRIVPQIRIHSFVFSNDNAWHAWCLGLDELVKDTIKLRMEMGNVPKRQQPDHRKNNSRWSPTVLQCSEKFPHSEASFSWPLNKYILVQW